MKFCTNGSDADVFDATGARFAAPTRSIHMSYEIEVRELSPQPMVGIRRTCAVKDIQKTLGEVLQGTFGYVMGKGAQPVGPPFTIYHRIDGETVELEGGCPTATALPGEGDVVAGELPGGEVAFTWHVGPYDTIENAHNDLLAWLAANDKAQAGPMWEVYWTDPGQEPDPARWKTELILPIR
jgi:effector-binding domain-containing protein